MLEKYSWPHRWVQWPYGGRKRCLQNCRARLHGQAPSPFVGLVENIVRDVLNVLGAQALTKGRHGILAVGDLGLNCVNVVATGENCSSSAFLIFFSGATLLLPPAWQAAQLPAKTLSPFSRSAARAGRPLRTAARSPSAMPNASGLQAALASAGPASDMAAACAPIAALEGQPLGARETAGAKKQTPAQRARRAAESRHATRRMATNARRSWQGRSYRQCPCELKLEP